MPILGSNVRTTAPSTDRHALRRVFGQALGARHESPRGDLDVFVFDDGGMLGVYYVDPDRALSARQHVDAGTWIELRVTDPAETTRTLAEHGLHPLSYHDDRHRYFQAPGGQVFRLAPR